jgi:hypothetical protein
VSVIKRGSVPRVSLSGEQQAKALLVWKWAVAEGREVSRSLQLGVGVCLDTEGLKNRGDRAWCMFATPIPLTCWE